MTLIEGRQCGVCKKIIQGEYIWLDKIGTGNWNNINDKTKEVAGYLDFCSYECLRKYIDENFKTRPKIKSEIK